LLVYRHLPRQGFGCLHKSSPRLIFPFLRLKGAQPRKLTKWVTNGSLTAFSFESFLIWHSPWGLRHLQVKYCQGMRLCPQRDCENRRGHIVHVESQGKRRHSIRFSAWLTSLRNVNMLFETLYIVYLSFLLAKPCSSFTLPKFLKRIQGPPLLRSDGVESRSNSAPGALLALPINELPNGTVNEGQALINSWLGRRATCNLGYYLCNSEFLQSVSPSTAFLGPGNDGN
jgi:hypothetical protein